MFRVPDDITNRKPCHTSPMGAVWLVASEELQLDGAIAEYVVRRLGAEVPMLKVGAVLGMASSLEGPHIAPATHWLRKDDGIWTATPRPIEASPLSETAPPRLSWGEALELWRPLANAVQSVHGRGLVHGHLTPWSVWWDSSAGRLIALDSGAWVADVLPSASPWWTGALVAPPETRRPRVEGDVANLARLLLKLHLPDGEADEASPNMEGVPAYAIPTLLRALDGEVQGLKELIAGTSLPPLHGVPSRVSDDQASTVLFGRVSGIEGVENARLGEGLRFWISYPEYDAEGHRMGHSEPRGAFFYQGAHGEVFDSVRHIWEGAELNVIDARVVEDSQGRAFLTARPETLPVLEPHWPVSVSSVIKADGCVNRYFVDVRDSGKSSRPLVFGNLVHGLMEDLAADANLDVDEAIEARLSGLRLAMLAAGLGDRDLDGFVADARVHFDAIRSFARARGEKARVGWTGDQAEVSRYSSYYGLEGRIDLVTQDEREGVQIVELKTGSQRREHVGQVRAYKLLWDGLAEERELRVSGYLLYSREAQLVSTPLDDPMRERSLLRARNALVAAHHDVATHGRAEIPYFMQYPRACNAPECRFRKGRCKAQTALLGQDPERPGYESWGDIHHELVDLARAYWRHLTRLIELENWVENAALGEILQSGRLREREESFRASSGLDLVSVDAETSMLTFEGHRGRLGVGERIIAHRGDFHRSPILRGTIVESSSRYLKVKARGAATAVELPRHAWIVDVMPARIGYRSAHQSVYKALASRRADFLEVILRPGGARAEELMTGDRATPLSPEATEALNDAQLEALATAVSSPVGALIQGPPGTGKTTVIAHLVRELVATGKRVVLSAQTNTAVDTMLEKLVEVAPDVRFMRVGRMSRSRAVVRALEDRGIDATTRFSVDLASSQTSLDAIAARLEMAEVVGCTTHAAARSDVIEILSTRHGGVPFDVAIVDEATQITEPMSLAPLNLARRFVLVGDHRQLPPIVQNEEANSLHIDGWTTPLIDAPEGATPPQLGLFRGRDASDTTGAMGLKGLDRSLFERLVDEGIPYVMLTTQYRMHSDIMAFSSGAFYGGQLEAHPSVASSTLALEVDEHGLGTVLDPARPVVFTHIEAESDGRINEVEARALVETIEALLAAGDARLSIGVVSPFRAQVQRIRDLLAESEIDASRVTVDTVERYQGSERDVILVSLVKTERTGEFLSDARRLNVTLTRARKKLIIFGHRGCLELDPLFRRLIEHPQTHSIPWPHPIDMESL